MTIVCEYARKSQSSPRSRPRPIFDSNLKVSKNKIGNEKKNKQQLRRQQKTNKKNKTKQNKTGGVREFLGGSEKDPAVAAEKRRGCPFSNKYE